MQLTIALALVALTPLVRGHGFIKSVTINGQTTTAQKTNVKQSNFRAVSDNTGWIGSDFFASDCSVCGCSNTPFNTVASPGGTIFSQAGQSAGQTPSTAAGSTVTLHVAGNPGEGWPHPNGHLTAYLGDCGGDCSNVDASSLNYFQIQGILNGVPTMRAAYDRGSDSNPWPVQIPSAVKAGSYILRTEIWAYGQSSGAEGGQVQAYPFCSNLQITGGGNANPATVQFPAQNANDKAIEAQGLSHLPGPGVNQLFGGNASGTGTAAAASNNTGAKAGAAGTGVTANAASPPSTGSSNTGSSDTGSSNTGSINAGSSNTGSSNAGTTPAGSSNTVTKNTSGRKKCSAKKASSSRKRRNSHRRHHQRNAAAYAS